MSSLPNEPDFGVHASQSLAVFGGGCFWCTEAVFKMLRGVSSVLPGYAGGTIENPTYEEVSTGTTGHAEVVQILYDPEQVSYRTLLTILFASHDPTSVNRQGNDVGTQYRSAIFYTTPEQKEEAERFIAEINASHKEGKSIATTVEPLVTFFVAENYHQDYFEHHPGDAYCELSINPKLKKVQEQYAELLKDDTKLIHENRESKKPIPSEEEMRKMLTDEQYRVLREKGTEAPFTGAYVHPTKEGTYACAVCGNKLFSSDSQFDSGTGWPSFDTALPGAVKQIADSDRTEIVCAQCGSHLGHVFNDGPTSTSQRYCINSVCLDLKDRSHKMK